MNEMIRKIKEIISKVTREKNRLFNPENKKFAKKLLLWFFGFITSNFSLTFLADIMHSKYFFLFPILLFISIICFMFFMMEIYRRYRYYSSIISELKSKNHPSYLVCTYLAARKGELPAEKRNYFDIEEVIIKYHIDLSGAGSEEKNRLSIHYSFNKAKATRNLSNFSFTTLSSHNTGVAISKNDFAPYIRINMNPTIEGYIYEYQKMKQIEKSYGSSHLHLWSAPPVGNTVRAGDVVSWEIKMEYDYDITKSNAFLIDPSNYCYGSIEKLHVIVELSIPDGKSKFTSRPEFRQLSNGLYKYDDKGEEYKISMRPATITETTSPGITIEGYEGIKQKPRLGSSDEKLYTLTISPISRTDGSGIS